MTKDLIQEIFHELDELRRRVESLEPAASPSIPNHEGQYIQEYDPKQCSKLLEAVFGERAQKIEDAQMDVIDAAMTFIDHRKTYPKFTYQKDVELREWGNRDFENYENLKKAAEKLNDL